MAIFCTVKKKNPNFVLKGKR